MNRTDRNISRVDYKVFHQIGQKGSKHDAQYKKLAKSLDKDSIMGKTQLVDGNSMIVLEIKGFMEEYELEELYGIVDVEKCISELKQLKKRLEDMHVNLRRVLGEEYEELYRNYDDDVKMITDWIKDARIEMSSRKIKHEREEKEEMARKEGEEKEEMARKERKDIKAEEKYFGIRVE